MDKVELNKELRKLPSVEQVLELDDLQPQIDRFSHPLVTSSIREVAQVGVQDDAGRVSLPR